MAEAVAEPNGSEEPTEVLLGSEFARAFPELGVAVQAMRPDQPTLLVLNEPLAAELELNPNWLRTEAGVRFMLGNELPSEAAPVAQIYAGHQFGSYSPRLGDGRALLLGELTDLSGHKRDVHLKGSGPTPFTRADGFAAVGPMLREYLVGEAMYALGIPTTRALAVIGTGRKVMRTEALDALPGAVLVRTAASHLRVGTFQFVRSTANTELLRRLADHAIARHYPHLASTDEPYLNLLRAVIDAQARLVAAWMLVGFVHGVMNTDNMTIFGETIDYGPCAFIDAYDPAAVFSSIDHAGRYAYGNQPGIAHWNLTRFAEALLPLLVTDFESEKETAKQLALTALEQFAPSYDRAWIAGMRAKLGLCSATGRQLSDAQVTELSAAMLDTLRRHRIDYTRFFRVLTDAAGAGDAAGAEDASLIELFGGLSASDLGDPIGDGTQHWFEMWRSADPDAHEMAQVNPMYIPRNQLLDETLDAASSGDLAPFLRMLDAVTHPFSRREGMQQYEMPPSPGLHRHITYCGT